MPDTLWVDARDFGYTPDGSTDNSPALQAAIDYAGEGFGPGVDSGGGCGGDVLLPKGTGLLASPITVHDGVRVLGQGVFATVLKMKDAFSASANFFRLGTPGNPYAVCDGQSRSSAGDFIINGSLASGGIAGFLTLRIIQILSIGNDTARLFTVYGTNMSGTAISASIHGANGDYATLETRFKTVTGVTIDGATAGNIAVGCKTLASFGSRLENVQLYSDVMTGAAGTAMVYTDNAQHTAGLKNIKIFGGNRHCTNFVKGYGGASLFTYEDVETFNHGNASYVASNNSQIRFDYAGLITPIRNVVMGGPGPAIGGAAAVGMEIISGFVNGENIHGEQIATGIRIATTDVNQGATHLKICLGGLGMSKHIHITSVVDSGTIVLEGCYPNGASVNVRDDRNNSNILGNIIQPTVF